jgi:hypothetical protein
MNIDTARRRTAAKAITSTNAEGPEHLGIPDFSANRESEPSTAGGNSAKEPRSLADTPLATFLEPIVTSSSIEESYQTKEGPWTPAEEQSLKIMRDAGNSWAEIQRCID